MDKPNGKNGLPSDVIELIIGVDLNPDNPQPINAAMKEDGENGWEVVGPMLVNVLNKMDPGAGFEKNMKSEDAYEAAQAFLGGEGKQEKEKPAKPMPEEDAEDDGAEKEDPFTRASKGFGKPEEEKPQRKSAGFKAAAKKAFGDQGEEEDDDDNLLKPEDFDIPNFNKEEEDEDNDQKSTSQSFNKQQFNSPKKSQRPAPRKATRRSDSEE